MRRGGERGTTLIEVLVAVTLLGLLMVGVLAAMRLGLSSLDRTNDKLVATRKVSGTQRILEQEIANFIPVVAQCNAAPGAPPVKMSFFQGEPQSMRFVSGYSLQEGLRGYPRILEFQVIPGADEKGVRLVVNEHLYTGPLGAGAFCLGRGLDPALGVDAPQFPRIQIGPGSFVLADRLAYCRFLFQEARPAPELTVWRERWILPQLPRAIRIEMAPLEANPAGLRPLTMTAPIRVTRIPIFDYADM